MRNVTITIYQFDELNETAKEKARDRYRAGALDYEWWDGIFDEAQRIGLKITGFGLDRRRYATGELTMSLNESCQAILTEHGETCESYTIASSYAGELATLTATLAKEKEELTEEEYTDKADDLDETYQEEIERLTGEYEKELLEAYSLMLEHEHEWQLADEQVDESIRANGYEFTEDGEWA